MFRSVAEKHEAAVWSERLAVQIGARVRQLRERPDWKMSAQALADRTAELGHELKRSVIANIESGRRANITVADLIVLAAALRVPPAMLVFPIGSESKTEVLPDVWVNTVDAVRWFDAAESRLTEPDSVEAEIAERWAYTKMAMYEKHADLLNQVATYRDWLTRRPSDDRIHGARAEAVQELEILRSDMESLGYLLPELPHGTG